MDSKKIIIFGSSELAFKTRDLLKEKKSKNKIKIKKRKTIYFFFFAAGAACAPITPFNFKRM